MRSCLHKSVIVTKASLKERGKLITTPVGTNQEGNLGIYSLPKTGPYGLDDPVGVVIEQEEDDAKVAVVERASLLDLLGKNESTLKHLPDRGER